MAAALLMHGSGNEVPSANSRRPSNSTNANMLMYWDLLQPVCRREQKIFGFGRSKDTNTYRFKDPDLALSAARADGTAGTCGECESLKSRGHVDRARPETRWCAHRRIRCAVWAIICPFILLIALPAVTVAKLPTAAPQLPEPTGEVVKVATVKELQQAVRGLKSHTTILIAPGEYRLTNTLYLAGPLQDVTIRGATHKPRDVVLVGRGMTNKDYGNVPHGILVGNVADVLIANLTIRDVYQHAIALQGGAHGCRRPHVYNCRLIDAGEQFFKANPGKDKIGVVEGKVQYCVIQYTDRCRGWYTNGVDVHAGRDWFVGHCYFRNIRAAADAGKLAGPAVLIWNRSRDTICEGNLFVNCERGIAFGLSHERDDDHQGGIIRNNIFYREASVSGDSAIIVWNSARTRVLHNTVLVNATSQNAIEVRFPASTGCDIRYNLCDADIVKRDGGAATLVGNVTDAPISWFTGTKDGALRLTSAAKMAIDKAQARSRCADGFRRPEAAARQSIGRRG